MDNRMKIGLEIKVISNIIKRKIDEIVGAVVTKDLTGMQGWIIGYIYNTSNTQDIFQKDIEKEFNIRRSTATGMLQLLEKNEYITREPVANDARLKKLVLTKKARTAHENLVLKINEFDSRLEEGLTEEEITVFYRIMDKIKKNLE